MILAVDSLEADIQLLWVTSAPQILDRRSLGASLGLAKVRFNFGDSLGDD